MSSAPVASSSEPANHGQLQGSCASLIIDAAGGAILRANAAGWALWGLAGQCDLDNRAPVAIDRAMPALQRLSELAPRALPGLCWQERLTFWTKRGLVQRACLVRADDTVGAGTVFAIYAQVEKPVVAGVASADVSPAPVGNSVKANSLCEVEHTAPEESRERALQARLAHELRTPLGAVIAYAEVLKSEHFGPLADARYRDYAGNIFESARHALNVVDSMLHGYASRSTPRFVFTDLDPQQVVERCLAVARPLAERAGLELGAHYAPGLPRVVADEVSLGQILLNLLANAIKFARRGDRVTVAVACNARGLLDISVADTGPGMGNVVYAGVGGNSGEQAKSPANKGIGLGLPLAKSLAKANGASVAIASSFGLGTCVTVSFAKDRLVPV